MKTQIGLLILTAVLTILIWIYADRATLGDITIIVPVAIEPAQADSNLDLRVVKARPGEPNVKQIKMTFRGPKSDIRMLEGEHSRGDFSLVVKIEGELPLTTVRRELFADLSQSPEIIRRGLTLEKISPQEIEFEVDRWRQVPVELVPDAGVFRKELQGKPLLVPERVTATVRQSQVGEVTTLQPLPVLLENPIREALLEQPAEETGRPLVFDVPLQRSNWLDIDATFKPAKVQATVRLSGELSRESLTIRRVGIMIKSQEFFDRGCEIEWEDPSAQRTTNIHVLVPASKVDLLKALDGTDRVDAYVVIDDNDLPPESSNATTTAPADTRLPPFRIFPVKFNFPEGFEDVKLDTDAPTVKLRIIQRTRPTEVAAPTQ